MSSNCNIVSSSICNNGTTTSKAGSHPLFTRNVVQYYAPAS
ncbi:hypothetical protein HanXRQr2_Chr10g0446741 [Helianthus annuus]|nr:hypothetical protein HanXRQr2_Chr10g0446741 [Helianthus annuus]KAJ0522339.1 hypothetical protein HanIR_Chr10g0481561 [Helianthus annuus]KAJ0530362.1 hypothetical protein HanHA89_Chr10g0389071 [Helianthus annuus]KAJ0585318.1 hypothetical protein HanHA89_Chr05g0198991 [Helianthus annuus]KAJ0642040.1 hypothetical protein HanLR1_Chr16g0633931 [Helianthus annuus]